MPDNIDNSLEINLDNVLSTGENTNRANTAPQPPTTPPSNEENKSASMDAPAAPEAPQIDEENSNSLKTLLHSFIDESTLDEDNKSIRTDLLTKYKGTSFDAEGNILDAEGNIVAPFSIVLEDSLKEDEVTLDADGNQIDAEGKVVKTKVELAVENTIVNKWHAESGYEFVDEKGNTKIYTDDEAGHKEFRDDVIEQQGKEWRSAFFSQVPELADITKHLLSGKSIDTYKSAIDYTTIDIKTLSAEQKEKYIRESYGDLDPARIDGLIQLFKDSNTIDSELEKAIPALIAKDAAAKAQRDAEYQAVIDKQHADQEKYWNEVEQTVNKGKLNDINIPDKDKAAFFDYLSTAIDAQGNSKEYLDSQKETLEQRLQIKYLRFKGYDLSKLVETKVKEAKVLSLKERIKQSAKIKSTPINDANKSKTSGGNDITIDKMLG